MSEGGVTLPQHVGLIMDGNGRWAEMRNLRRREGHHAGYRKLKKGIDWAIKAGIPYVSAYGFSTENWGRSREEVGDLMNLLRYALRHDIHHLMEKGIRLHVVGERTRLDEDLQMLVEEAEEKTKNLRVIDAALLVSYGGRSEILSAAKQLALDPTADVEALTEEGFRKYLWMPDHFPDADMIIRTGGHMCLSNFLTWESSYAELFFTETLWPDFTESEFLEMIYNEYPKRDRTRGVGHHSLVT